MNRISRAANDNGMSNTEAWLRLILFLVACIGAVVAFVRWIGEG